MAYIDGEGNGCTFQWKIENISQCGLELGERIDSPHFNADGLEGTKWSISQYPKGKVLVDYLGVEIYREEDCNGPDYIAVNCKISFLDDKGSFLKEFLSNKNFGKGGNLYQSKELNKIFVSDKETFIPNDVLTVQCTIWKYGERLVKPQLFYARTRFKVKSESYVWEIERFSTYPLSIRSRFKDDLIDFEIVLKEGKTFAENMVINGIFFDDSVTYFSYRIAVINSKGNEEYWMSKEFSGADIKKGIQSFLLSSQMLRENMSRYLTNDTLTLDFKYHYSFGKVVEEFCDCGTISTKPTKSVVKERNEEHVQQLNSQMLPVLVNDLKTMYNDEIFSDMELRTSTKNFPAHKSILSARSSVFRRMFSNDMLEKNCGYINISDLENDTVHQMLLYIYTDSLDDMQLENAFKLYTAADKYDILTLRRRCSSFLKDNLCPTNACDTLALADRHQDGDLKKSVQDFILKHDKEVFNSEEWKLFMTTHLQLAADVMFQKVSLG